MWWERSTSGSIPTRTVRHAALCVDDRPADSLAALRAAGGELMSWGLANPAVVAWRSAAARALARLGRVEDAAALAAEEVAFARRWGAPHAVGAALLTVAHVDAAAADDALDEAIALTTQSGHALVQCEALLERGARLRRQNARAAARPFLRQARGLAHDIGAADLAHRAHSELWSTGARPRPLSQTGAAALTVRERRVVDLAAQSHTNRHIAEELCVTVKTVETQLTSAYRKLGVRGRPDLARALGLTR